jgi:hypothetical protein
MKITAVWNVTSFSLVDLWRSCSCGSYHSSTTPDLHAAKI